MTHLINSKGQVYDNVLDTQQFFLKVLKLCMYTGIEHELHTIWP